MSDYKYPDCLSFEGLRQGKRLDAEQCKALHLDCMALLQRARIAAWDIVRHGNDAHHVTLTGLVRSMIEIENAAREIRNAMQDALTKGG